VEVGIWLSMTITCGPAADTLAPARNGSAACLRGYDDYSRWVVSSQYEDVKGLKLTTKGF